IFYRCHHLWFPPIPIPQLIWAPHPLSPPTTGPPYDHKGQDNISKPLVRQDGTPSCSTTTLVPDEPTSYLEASRYPKWRNAMAAKFKALI
ncbi:LOW QUALITY PROTEIN: hypothetical protein V2J09_021685, partial [Rumex salicifolius]